jgi:hypothetical protein
MKKKLGEAGLFGLCEKKLLTKVVMRSMEWKRLFYQRVKESL